MDFLTRTFTHQTEIPEEDEENVFDLGTVLDREQLRDELEESERRARESLKVFEPLPAQAAFFGCRASIRLLRGGNRGGKTLPAAVEVARAVTGQDPFGKYPARDGFAMAVGWDLKHCADVMWKKLTQPAGFKIIRDPDTLQWRAFRPFLEWDAENEDLAMPAPPLIPKRFIKDIAWEDKKRGIPEKVTFTTGWVLNFYSSKGNPPQGIDVDLAWFDEELQNENYFKEAKARLLDKRVRRKDGTVLKAMFFWSATPLAGTQVLLDLHIMAEEQINEESPRVQEFTLSQLDNPHISAQSKKEFAEGLTEEEYRVRVLGDYSILGSRVYPTFAPDGAHGCDPFPVPENWTRYIAIDPGRQVCACLFVAVPPDHLEVIMPAKDGRLINYGKKRRFIYQELYIKGCDAKIFADRLGKAIGDQEIYSFIIDHRAGRATEIGSGVTVEEQYRRALKEKKVRCTRTEYGFTWGSDDVQAGIGAVRLGMHLDADGMPPWIVMRETTPQFKREAQKYSNRKLPNGTVTDDPVKLNDHLMDCWRYLAMANVRYVTGKGLKKKVGNNHEALKRKKEKALKENGYSGAIRLG